MDFDYSKDVVVQVSVIKHIEKGFQDFPDTIGKPASIPASNHLFQVHDLEESKGAISTFPSYGHTAPLNFKQSEEGCTDRNLFLTTHVKNQTRMTGET